MNCAICQRPLLEGAPACVVCGAPVQASPPAPAFAGGPRASAVPPLGGAPGASPGYDYGYRPSIPTAPPGSAYGQPYAQMPPQMQAPQPMQMQAQAPQGYYGGYASPQIGQAMAPMGQGALQAAPNNLAVASLICGLLGLVPLWIGFILCILAITFGILGIQRAGQLPGARGKGMAIAGLVLGAVFLLPAGCGL